MTDDPIDKQADFIHQFDSNSRGKYLIQATMIENIIDDILGFHFCGKDRNRREMLIATIFNDLGFSSKIKNILKILELRYPQLIKKYPNLSKELDNVRALRNKFAHSTPDTTIEFLKEKTDYIRLEYYKNGEKKHYKITEEYIHEKLKECSRVVFALAHILKIVSNGEDDIKSQ